MTEFHGEHRRFALTLDKYGAHFNDRTTVDLKDKWRSWCKKKNKQNAMASDSKRGKLELKEKKEEEGEEEEVENFD